MKWDDVREHFPHQWLLVEATRAHSAENRRIIDDLAVVERYEDGRSAMRGYTERHRQDPMRELYVLHTDRERLEITELNWLGLRVGALDYGFPLQGMPTMEVPDAGMAQEV